MLDLSLLVHIENGSAVGLQSRFYGYFDFDIFTRFKTKISKKNFPS